MNDTRSRRRKAISDMLRAGKIARQEDVTSKLAALGFEVTQATVSRDLDQLGAVKVKRDGTLVYALPDQLGESDWAASRLQHILSEWVISVEAAGSLVVVRTPPGSAHLVGLAIDQANLPELAGSISGDDTLFLALRDGNISSVVAERLRSLSLTAAST